MRDLSSYTYVLYYTVFSIESHSILEFWFYVEWRESITPPPFLIYSCCLQVPEFI